MTDQTNSIGVPLDQDELADPSENLDAPDPLLNEAARSGALSTIGSKNDQQSRAAAGRESMTTLRQQYGAAAGQANEAYAAQRQTLQDATKRLLAMQMGPSAQEQAYRTAAAWGTGEPGTGRINAGGINAAQANNLQQVREAEQAKQQLLTQYGMQIPQSQLGAANQRMNQITQQMRIQQSENNNAANAVDKTAKPLNKYFMPDPTNPNGPPVFSQELYNTDMQAHQQIASDAAKAKLAAQASQTGMVTPEAIEIAYKTGKAPTGFSRSSFINSQLWQGVHQRALQDGNDPGAFFANTQMTQAGQGVLKDFTDGKESQAIEGINTATKHTETLMPLIDALDNGNVTLINKAKQYVQTNWTGGTAPTDLDTVKNFLSGEVSKAVLPQGGGEREREEISAALQKANNPQAIKSALQKWQLLLAGKTVAMKNKWDVGTRGQYGDFNRFLLPETQKYLGTPAATPNPTAQTNPLVNYYVQLSAWNAGGKKGPPPAKPQ